MENRSVNYHASIDLKDGHSTLATWVQSFEQRPGLDDAVRIPVHFLAALDGFEPTAVITRIESGSPLPDRVEAVALCRIKNQDRPRIVLNSARIAPARKAEAERYLRDSLPFPLIYWESSHESDPVIRFHDPATGRKSCPGSLQAGLISLLNQAAAL